MAIRAACAVVRRLRERDIRADMIAREVGAHRVSALLTFHGDDFREVLRHLDEALDAVEILQRYEVAP